MQLKYGVLYFDQTRKGWLVKAGQGTSDSRLEPFMPTELLEKGLFVAEADKDEEEVKRAEALAISEWWLDQDADTEYGEEWWRK